MGVVYKARDPVIDRVVAVKTISTQQDGIDASQIERLLMEARSAGRLHHNNIVTVFDFGHIDDTAYIVLEYVEGVDVAQLITNSDPVALPQKIDVILQICQGLGFAHDRGVTHRDMKPSNVRLTEDGTAKILDFGLARFDNTQLTKTGYISGTIAYMSPERINGQTGQSDDIFALGASAYELLTYRRAYPGASTPEVMFKILTEPPPAPSTIAEVPPELDAVLLKCMAREVSDRWPSPQDFATALEEAFESDAAQHFVTDPARSDAFKDALRTWTPRRRTRDTRSRPMIFADRTPSGDTPTQVFSGTGAATSRTAVEPSLSSDVTMVSHPMTSPATQEAEHPRSRRPLAALAAGGILIVAAVLAAVLWPRTVQPDEPMPLPKVSGTPATASASVTPTDTTARLSPQPPADATQLGAPLQGTATSDASATVAPPDTKRPADAQPRRRPTTTPNPNPRAPAPVPTPVDTRPQPKPQPPAQETEPPVVQPVVPEPQPPRQPDPRVEIATFISRVAAAYESRDGAFFREHHLGYTDAMGNAVRNSPSRSVRLEVLSIATPVPNQARVLVERTDEFTSGAPPAKQRLTFVLERTDSGWKIRRFERS